MPTASRRFPLRLAAVLCVLTVLGRVLGYLYGETSTNIVYADWVGTVLGYAEDLLGCLRSTYMLCAAAYGYLAFGIARSYTVLAVCAAMSLFDMLSRLAVDLWQNSLTELLTVALIWLALQFAYELVLCVLAWLTARLVDRLRTTSSHPRAENRYSPSMALRACLLWQLLARVGMEGYNILSFTRTYTAITSAEVSSMVGYILYAVILYGGVAFLIEEGLRTLWNRRYTKNTDAAR